jgi:hypothetical protein
LNNALSARRRSRCVALDDAHADPTSRSLGEIRSRLDSSSARLFAGWAATEGLTIPFQPVKVRLMDAGVSPAAANAAAAGLANTPP